MPPVVAALEPFDLARQVAHHLVNGGQQLGVGDLRPEQVVGRMHSQLGYVLKSLWS